MTTGRYVTGSGSDGPTWRLRLPNPRSPLPAPVPPPAAPRHGRHSPRDAADRPRDHRGGDDRHRGGADPRDGGPSNRDGGPPTHHGGDGPRHDHGHHDHGDPPTSDHDTGGGRAVPLARPAPDHPARHQPPPPAAVLLLCGSGVFLFLAIAAAVIGASAGKHEIQVAPTSTGSSPYNTPQQYRDDYGTPEKNRLYRTGRMASVRCDAVVTSSAPAAYETFVRRATACLDRTWRDQLDARGIDYTAPGLVISRSENPTSPCRSGNSGYLPFAFYCPANATIYYSLQSAARVPVPQDKEYLVTSPAHEYGHHIQQLTGISASYDARYMEVYPDDVAAYTRLTRRLELQAQCFAGVFVGSNADTMHLDRARMAAAASRTGDDAITGVDDDPRLRTHGSFGNNRRWLVENGWDTGDPGGCNTWQARDSTVD